MLQLQDIVQITEVVKITQGEVEIRPVDIEPLAQSIFRNQQVLNLMSSGDIDPSLLFATAPAFVREMICTSLNGNPKTREDMEAVKRIAAGDQIKLISRIFAISFPDGVADFLGGPPEPVSDSPDAVAEAAATDAQTLIEEVDPDLVAALSR